MNIIEYVIGRLDKDQFGCPYTTLGPNKGRYFISKYLDSLTGTEHNSGSYYTYNEYDGLVEELYNLIFESESISMGGLCSIHFQIVRVYPRKTIDTERVNDLLREVR